MRITLDLRYPGIVSECEAAIRDLLPANRVHRILRRGGFLPQAAPSCVDVSAFSKSWPCLIPQHGRGPKHLRCIVLAPWQQDAVARRPEALLRGLIHSDGARFVNTGRGGWRQPRYGFYNRSTDIRRIFCATCDELGLRWTQAPPNTVYVSRKDDVAALDSFIGPKR